MRILQEHSLTLFQLSSLLLCLLFLTACIRLSQIFFGLLKLTGLLSEKSSSTSLNVMGSVFLPASAVNRLTLMAAISCGLACGTIAWNIFDRLGTGVVNKDGSVVLSRSMDGRHFCMVSKKGTEYSVTPCERFPNDIVAGVTLTKFRFLYDSHSSCNDWTSRQEVGYTAWRSLDDKPILTDVPRSASTGRSCANPATTATAVETEARAR